ncbi:hypothetical protein [Pandoraea sp. NPDC087047]|uniref:hypothetical protein n=1 Tax=Pandoraea sp. NPDC087047 TaxID=3364390 RepID=UPI00381098AB
MHDEYVNYARHSTLPMMVDQWPVTTRLYKKGASIGEKYSEIASQLERIRNAQQALGVSTYAVDKLSAAFNKSYDKATAGYWRGGLRDPFWRCLTTPNSPGFFCSMVADQLEAQCPELLTPSARRFLKILNSLTEMLEVERDLLSQYEQLVKSNAAERQSEPRGEWDALDRAKRRSMALRAETAPMMEQMRRAVDRARSCVRPEKKHHGKREAINGGLYVAAAMVTGVAFLVSTSVIAIASFAVTMLIRCVSLGSIRGFDREKGWKAVEGLLDQAKEFINSEENNMYATLTGMISFAQADQDRLIWEQGQRTWDLAKATHEQMQRTHDQVQRTNDQVQKTWDLAKAAHEQGQRTYEQMQRTHEQGQRTYEQMQRTHEQLQSTQDRMQSTQDRMQRTQDRMQRTQDQMQKTQEQMQGQLGSLDHKVGSLEQTVTSLSGEFKKMRNTILFDSASRRTAPADSLEAPSGTQGATARVPMARATSLDAFQTSRSMRHLMA